MNEAAVVKLAKSRKLPRIMWDTQAFRDHLCEFAAAVEKAERARCREICLSGTLGTSQNYDDACRTCADLIATL